MPHEITIGEIYIPPFLLVISLSYIATHFVTATFAKFNVYRYLAYPAIADISLFILMSLIIGLLIPFV
ncbi:hypothetical protein JCM19240_1236 [Vibrio maritimus]|uniref:DUF1656 domain-containing protein n=1 Tax=Vibrio maritimus TaxID=990268 RepID=A0A090T515_9VIBR|nr:hypothetical protein JCM19240_1236 [Vibrio maritimus]